MRLSLIISTLDILIDVLHGQPFSFPRSGSVISKVFKFTFRFYRNLLETRTNFKRRSISLTFLPLAVFPTNTGTYCKKSLGGDIKTK